ncbi:hypothetical protein ACIRD3_40045 [Kitasatospora sp. NPDC093550]|uniref:hypothetical protein n=1 Tax=Kitasatospora sp. NPDC093550 TaxID=3364089 RepID=UPI003811163F
MAEPKHYTTGEILGSAWIIAKAAVTAARGGDPAKYDGQVERLQAKACAREQAEQEAREKAEKEKREAEAKAKAERRANSWF